MLTFWLIKVIVDAEIYILAKFEVRVAARLLATLVQIKMPL